MTISSSSPKEIEVLNLTWPKKASKAQHTDSITGHAPDITLQEASAIINRAKVEYPAEAEPLWMLLSTGVNGEWIYTDDVPPR